ncbi:MAG TPA: glycosyltransferase [Bryobacteraceae bacterium]|nr:glycosyltransferase [Bryobacteraceae bacterium]
MDSSSPALLQIAPRFNQTPTSGAEYRNLYLASRLARQMAVTHMGFRSPDAPGAVASDNPNHRFVAVPRNGSYRAQDLLRGALGPMPFSVLNYTRPEMSTAIADHFRKQRFDIVLLEGVHLGGYLSQLRSLDARPLVVCDWHNVESEILERYSRGANGGLRRAYARLTAKRLEQYERWFVNQCDMHIAVSERDAEVLRRSYGAKVPVVVVENGVPLEYFSRVESDSRERFRVLFSGAMDYHANVEAAVWFALEAWPSIHAARPQAVFTIVGRNPSSAVRALGSQPGIEVTGTVPEVRPYYKEALVAVVPLRVGGGTRIKILEAMAAGVPVVSTALGAEGLVAAPGEHYVRADSSREIATAVTDLLANPSKAGCFVSAGRDLVRRRYDWTFLGDRLADALLQMLNKKEPASHEPRASS